MKWWGINWIVGGPDKLDQVEAGVQHKVLKSEVVIVPDDDESRITRVTEDEDGEEQENDN